MNARLPTIWGCSRLVLLLVVSVISLAVAAHVAGWGEAPRAGPFSPPTVAVATAQAVHVVAAVPRLTPTTHPTALAGSSPTSVLRPRAIPAPKRAKRLRMYQLERSPRRPLSVRPRTAKAANRPVATATPSDSPSPLPIASETPVATATPGVSPSPLPIASPTQPTPASVAATDPGVPIRLRIPVLNIDTHVESVGLLGDAMGVPTNPWNVAWYKLGPQPGMTGNAVIDGHLDTATGPAVFLHLGNLRSGDLLYVTAGGGKGYTFKVTNMANYPVDNAPLARIFGASKDAHLNLITCSGDWLPQQQGYSQRLVVYSTLVT